MLWLQSPQWGRWSIAILITLVAIWTEFSPERSVDHPFATEQIAAGDAVGTDNTELRSIPADLMPPVAGVGFATRSFAAGEPITVGGLSADPVGAPEGWWSIEVGLPAGAGVGTEVQLVLLDSGVVVPGRVTSAVAEDPLSDRVGSVAVPPDMAATVAVAVVGGRIAVLIKTE